jgi:hypothetical protein
MLTSVGQDPLGFKLSLADEMKRADFLLTVASNSHQYVITNTLDVVVLDYGRATCWGSLYKPEILGSFADFWDALERLLDHHAAEHPQGGRLYGDSTVVHEMAAAALLKAKQSASP